MVGDLRACQLEAVVFGYLPYGRGPCEGDWVPLNPAVEAAK